MRLILTMATAALAITGLSACGQSEEGFRANLRTQGIANCKTGANANGAAAAQLSQAGMSVDEFCTCAIDRYMRATPYEQLKQEMNNPSPPGLTSAGMQCVAERAQRSAANAMAGATSEMNAAEPAAPGEAANASEAAAEDNSAGEQ
jgi:hypothetical protein